MLVYLKYSHPWLKVLPGLLPVLLNAQVVDQGRATGRDQEVEDGQDLLLYEHDQDEADSLKQPVDHVELCRDKVPSLPCNFGCSAEAIHPVILSFPKPKNNWP